MEANQTQGKTSLTQSECDELGMGRMLVCIWARVEDGPNGPLVSNKNPLKPSNFKGIYNLDVYCRGERAHVGCVVCWQSIWFASGRGAGTLPYHEL